MSPGDTESFLIGTNDLFWMTNNCGPGTGQTFVDIRQETESLTTESNGIICVKINKRKEKG